METTTIEVKVMTARVFANVVLNGERTVRDALVGAGIANPDEMNVRIDGELSSDLNRELNGGESISAFSAKTVATAGVKGGGKS